MKTALAGYGYKTHFVSDYQASKGQGKMFAHIKTLCNMSVSHMFDSEKLAPGSDGYCKRCQATKIRMEKK